VEPFSRAHPQIRVSVTAHLGASQLLPQAIAAILTRA
jgi:hypothetical protein